MARYRLAKWQPSTIIHPARRITLGITIHNTYGSSRTPYPSTEAGDANTLDGPNVDAHFLVARDGDIYQFLDTDSAAWTARQTANATCIQIETEGRRDVPWTPKQLDSVSKLCLWLCRLYGIPVRKVDPTTADDLASWRGLFDHRDLQGIDGNDHSDGVPVGTGWPRFIKTIKAASTTRLTIRQRLMRAGFGANSARAIIRALKAQRKTKI